MSNFEEKITINKKELVNVFLQLVSVHIFLCGLNEKGEEEINETSESCPLFNLRQAMDFLNDKIDLNNYMANVNINPFPVKEVTDD